MQRGLIQVYNRSDVKCADLFLYNCSFENIL